MLRSLLKAKRKSEPPRTTRAHHMNTKLRALANRFSGISALALAAFCASSAVAGPKEVSGPGADAACFAPRDASVKYLQYPGKKGPLRVALLNGYVGNTWRIQMVQTGKAYVEEPDVKPDVAEFKVVGVGGVPFDVVFDSDKGSMVNESDTDIGKLAGKYLLSHIPTKTGKILEVR